METLELSPPFPANLMHPFWERSRVQRITLLISGDPGPVSISFFIPLPPRTKAKQNEKFNYLWKHEKRPLCLRTFFIRAESWPHQKKKRKEKKRNTVQYNCRAKPKQLPTLTDYGLTAIVALKRLQNGSKKRGGGWWKTGANPHVICFYAESSEFHFQHARQRANSNQQYVHYKARYIKLTHAKGPRAAEMAQRRVLHGRGVGWWHIK